MRKRATKQSSRKPVLVFGPGLCAFAAFWASAGFAQDFSIEYRTAIPLVAGSIEEEESSALVETGTSIVEEELPREVFAFPVELSAKRKPTPKKVETLTDRDVEAIEAGDVTRLSALYLSMLSTSSVKSEDKQFIASSNAVHPLSSVASLEVGKTYSFLSDGSLGELDTKDFRLPSRRRRVEGNGWTIVANDAQTPEPVGLTAVARVSARPGSLPVSGEFVVGSTSANTASQRFNSVLKEAASLGPSFEVDASQTRALGLASAQAANAGAISEVSRVSIRGRVSVSSKNHLGDIRVRISGTEVEVVPDRDGFFEFPEVPSGSKLELLVWDEHERYSRRIVPVTALARPVEYDVALESSVLTRNTAMVFGEVWDSSKAGFCGVFEAQNKELLLGAKVYVSAEKSRYATHFFDQYGLPAQSQVEIEKNGRFCVYNVREELIDVSVVLANGHRRSFSIHLKPTVFEPSLVLNIENSLWRPVSQMELVDFDEVVEAAKRESSFVFGTPGLRSWFDGTKSATWARVSHAALATDRAYAPVVTPREHVEPSYFSLGEEHSEVRWGTSSGEMSGFSLVSRQAIRENESASGNPVSRDPLVLKMLDGSSVDEMERASGKSISREKGIAFVSVDLAALNIEYSDARFSVRDAWTGRRIGEMFFVPSKGQSNSRFVRFFVGDLPAGQHTLMLTDRSGALKWLDLVRSRPGMLQVLSIGD